MKSQSKLFWVGLGVYTLGFLLPAVGKAPGYQCAIYSVLFAAGQVLARLRGEATLIGAIEVIALFLSGMINVLFVIFVMLYLSDRGHRTLLTLFGVVLPLMFPSSWIVFHYEKLHPLYGYYLWTIGMVVVLVIGSERVFRSNRYPIAAA